MASQQIKWKQQYKRGLYIRVGVPKVLLQDTFRFPQLIRKRQRKTSRSHNRTVTITALEKQSQPQIYGRMCSLMSGLQSVKRRIRKWSDLKEHLQISGTCWELSADRQNQQFQALSTSQLWIEVITPPTKKCREACAPPVWRLTETLR